MSITQRLDVSYSKLKTKETQVFDHLMFEIVRVLITTTVVPSWSIPTVHGQTSCRTSPVRSNYLFLLVSVLRIRIFYVL